MTDALTTSRTAAPQPSLGLALSSLLRADFAALLRNRVSGLVSIILPIAIVVATSFGARTSRLGGPELIIGLALTIGIATSSLLGYALSTAHDRDVGVLQRLRVTPAPTWTIMGSRLVVQVIANLVASVIVVIVGSIVHGLSLNVAQYALVLAVAVLAALVFLSIGQALVGLVVSTSAVNAIGRILLIVLLLLGLLGATGLLGDTLKVIAEWSPVGALMTLFADALSLAPWSVQDTYSLLACAGYVIVFAFVGIRWFRWEAR